MAIAFLSHCNQAVKVDNDSIDGCELAEGKIQSALHTAVLLIKATYILELPNKMISAANNFGLVWAFVSTSHMLLPFLDPQRESSLWLSVPSPVRVHRRR